MILTAHEITSQIQERFSPRVISPPRDDRYFCPALEWLDKFGAWCLRARPDKYQREKFDCDDFALWASVMASYANMRNVDTQECGHAVFYAHFLIREGVEINTVSGPNNHAACLVLCNDTTWHVFEPQNGKHFCLEDNAVYFAVDFLLM